MKRFKIELLTHEEELIQTIFIEANSKSEASERAMPFVKTFNAKLTTVPEEVDRLFTVRDNDDPLNGSIVKAIEGEGDTHINHIQCEIIKSTTTNVWSSGDIELFLIHKLEALNK